MEFVAGFVIALCLAVIGYRIMEVRNRRKDAPSGITGGSKGEDGRPRVKS